MTLRSLGCAAAFLFLALGGAVAAPAADELGYRVVRKLELGGDGGWDYLVVDSAARRLYVTRSTRVMVLDADSGAVVGEIPNTPGVHGVAIVPELNRGFTSNGRSSTISIFDLKTLKPLGEIKSAGENPDAILYDPASRRVFAFNGRSASTTAIDAATGEIAGTVALEGRPEFAAADAAGRVYVNLEDKSMVVVIDARKLAVEKRWPLAPCEEPSGMAIDREHKRLFVGCGNKQMAVLDAENGKVVATVPIGVGVDANAYDPATGLAFSSNGDGTLTVVHEDSPDKYRVAQTVATQPGARTMALDEKTHQIFLATARFGPPPPPTTERPHPRPSIVPGSFVILIVAK